MNSIDVEQAIARGLPASRIARQLKVPIDFVHAVWDALDEVNEQLEDRPVPQHGTISGYASHQAHGTGPCGPCKTARAAYDRKHRRGSTGRVVAGHGTHTAYVRHRTKGEAACEPCRAAESAYSVERRRARRKEAAA